MKSSQCSRHTYPSALVPTHTPLAWAARLPVSGSTTEESIPRKSAHRLSCESRAQRRRALRRGQGVLHIRRCKRASRALRTSRCRPAHQAACHREIPARCVLQARDDGMFSPRCPRCWVQRKRKLTLHETMNGFFPRIEDMPINTHASLRTATARVTPREAHSGKQSAPAPHAVGTTRDAAMQR